MSETPRTDCCPTCLQSRGAAYMRDKFEREVADLRRQLAAAEAMVVWHCIVACKKKITKENPTTELWYTARNRGITDCIDAIRALLPKGESNGQG